VKAVSEAAAVKSQTAEHTAGTTDSAPVAGTSGATTTLPDLQAGQLSNDGTFVAFTLDRPLGAFPSPGAAGTSQASFQVWLADGALLTSACVESQASFAGVLTAGTCGANGQLPNNVVRAFFVAPGAALSHEKEYAVKAAIVPGAVQTTGTVGNGFAEVPIGGNAGAFAGAFTTGPDAFNVNFDNTTNTASVKFDQRVFGTVPSSFVLLDANGTPLPGGTGQQAAPTNGAPIITVSFTGVSVSQAKALEIKGPLATPFAGAAAVTANGYPTIQQIVSPVGAASVLTPGSKVHWVRIHLRKHLDKRRTHRSNVR
jgi:hypothetical protein